jgi:hypothetical protein
MSVVLLSLFHGFFSDFYFNHPEFLNGKDRSFSKPQIFPLLYSTIVRIMTKSL